jgi:ATP/maltotriose-dependent transcriptional regulator MalT
MPYTVAITPASFTTFGALLRNLRRRARLSQRELATAVGYSESQISRLEQNQRLPDPSSLASLFVPALELDDEPELVARLLDLAAAARNENPDDIGVVAAPLRQRGDPDPPGALEAIPDPPACEVVRTRALARLREQLTTRHAVALCATAGMGKTSLAAALARERAYAAPVFWMTFTRGVNTSVDAIMRQLALFLAAHGQDQATPILRRADAAGSALALDEQLGLVGAGLVRMAWSQVGDPTTHDDGLPLLCFDDVQFVQDDTLVMGVLHHLIAATPVAMLLIGSEALALPGIVAAWLPRLARAEGLELIGRLGLAVAPALAMRLLKKTGGNPMLLRLAIGQLRDQPGDLTTAIARLEQAPRLATYLLEMTLGRLQPPAWRLIAFLSIFRQPIDLYDELLAGMSQIADSQDDFAAALAELQRRQLIDHPAHATLHPLVRGHVYALLATELPRRQELHLLAAEWTEQSGDVVEAAYHYAWAGELQQAIEVLADRGEALIRGGQALAAAPVIDEVLAQTRQLHSAETDLLRRLLTFRGDLLAHTLRAEIAEASYREALALAEEPAAEAHIIRRLADILIERGQATEALQLCQPARAALPSADTLLWAQLAAAESRAHFMLSHYDQAVQVAKQALDLAGRLGADLPRQAAEISAWTHDVLGAVLLIRRRFDTALDHYQRAIEDARQAGLGQLEQRCRVEICGLQLAQGQLDAALLACEETLPQLRQAGDSYASARLLNIAALARMWRGELEEALETIDDACVLHAQIGDTRGLAAAENRRATILITLGRVAEARALIERVLATSDATGELRERAYSMDTLCVIEMLEGNAAGAIETLRHTLALPIAAGDQKLRGDLFNDLALALLMKGDLDEAQQLLAGDPPAGAGLSSELERELLRGLLALVRGDIPAARTIAAAVAARAEPAWLRLRHTTALWLAEATQAPAPRALPWMLWVPDVAPPT